MLKATRLSSFDAFISILFDYITSKPALVVFDEFQNFHHVEPSLFSILQKNWDTRKDEAKGHLVMVGSAFSLMRKIFENEKEPLFNRPTGKLHLQPFDLDTIRLILEDHQTNSIDQLLPYFAVFGGIPRYYDLIERADLFGPDFGRLIRNLILEPNCVLRDEGRPMTTEAFGRENSTYFAILEAISRGHTRLSNIASQAGVPVTSASKYLDDLVSIHQIVERRKPVPSIGGRQDGRYSLNDNFLTFWFRYIYRNLSTLEIGNTAYLSQLIQDDLTNYFGIMFERLVLRRVIELNRKNRFIIPCTQIGGYWDRGGNETDVVGWSEPEHACLVGECKLNSKRINAGSIHTLRQRGLLIQRLTKCDRLLLAFFVADEPISEQRDQLQKEGILLFGLNDLFE